MAKRLNNDSPIGDILREFIQSNNLQKGMDSINVREAWAALMGPGVNTYTREIMLKNGTLYVELTSAVLREELSYGREKIVKMINEQLGREVVTTVVLR